MYQCVCHVYMYHLKLCPNTCKVTEVYCISCVLYISLGAPGAQGVEQTAEVGKMGRRREHLVSTAFNCINFLYFLLYNSPYSYKQRNCYSTKYIISVMFRVNMESSMQLVVCIVCIFEETQMPCV